MKNSSDKLAREYTSEQQVAARTASDFDSQDPFWQDVIRHLEEKEKKGPRQSLVKSRPKGHK